MRFACVVVGLGVDIHVGCFRPCRSRCVHLVDGGRVALVPQNRGGRALVAPFRQPSSGLITRHSALCHAIVMSIFKPGVRGGFEAILMPSRKRRHLTIMSLPSRLFLAVVGDSSIIILWISILSPRACTLKLSCAQTWVHPCGCDCVQWQRLEDRGRGLGLLTCRELVRDPGATEIAWLWGLRCDG